MLDNGRNMKLKINIKFIETSGLSYSGSEREARRGTRTANGALHGTLHQVLATKPICHRETLEHGELGYDQTTFVLRS